MDGAQNGQRLKSRNRIVGFGPLIASGWLPLPSWGASPKILASLRGADGAVKQGRGR
jgi:hypothetical protein